VFALERLGFEPPQVDGAREAANSGFSTAMGFAGAVLLASALLAALGLGTPALDETGEMPAVVAPSPLAIAVRRRLADGSRWPAPRLSVRGPPWT